MKKTIILAALIMAIILPLAVFAGGVKEPSSAAASDFNIEAPAAETVIDVMGWTFPITDFYRTQFEDLNGIENLTVNVQFLDSSGAQEQVRLALSGGKKSPYEVIHAANSQVSEWGFPGWLMPINDLVEKYWDEYDLGDIPQSAWDAASIDGQIFGVPVIGNSMQLIYRSDLFEKHGIKVPDTYAEVIAAAKILKEKEKSIDLPFVMNLHAGWAWEIEFFQMLGAFGGTFLNADNTPAFNGSEGIKALELMREVAEVMGAEGLAYSIDDVEVGLHTGRLAFANTWASRAANMSNPEVSDFVEELKFAPSPRAVAGGKRGAAAWNDFYCIPANIDGDRELIFKVIMEVADLESQKGAIEFGITTRMKSLESDKAGVYMSASMTSLAEGAGAYPINPAIGLVRTALQEFLPLLPTGESAKSILDKAAASYTEEAKANGFIK
jgi:ABC-type glycerol-3-phosphate transport system substrate-binding protein